jgi:hypothetical protein
MWPEAPVRPPVAACLPRLPTRDLEEESLVLPIGQIWRGVHAVPAEGGGSQFSPLEAAPVVLALPVVAISEPADLATVRVHLVPVDVQPNDRISGRVEVHNPDVPHRLYLRFPLSFRDVEELLAERGVRVSYETVRRWTSKFGPLFAEELRRREVRHGRTWHLDEVFLRMNGRRVYLWRAVDEHGQVLDIFVQERRDACAAERFFRRLLGQVGDAPERIVTDKLASHAVAEQRIPALNAVKHVHVRAAARLNN